MTWGNLATRDRRSSAFQNTCILPNVNYEDISAACQSFVTLLHIFIKNSNFGGSGT